MKTAFTSRYTALLPELSEDQYREIHQARVSETAAMVRRRVEDGDDLASLLSSLAIGRQPETSLFAEDVRREVSPSQQHVTTCVYAIEGVGTGLIKIGRTANLRARLASLQTGSPVPLRLLCSARESQETSEATLHELFAPFRVHGEWFALDAADVVAELMGFGRAEVTA